MLSKKQKIIYSILVIFVVVVYVFSNYILDFDKDKKSKAVSTTPTKVIEGEPTNGIEQPIPTKMSEDDMDMSIKGHANYNVPVTIKADKCSMVYRVANGKIENDKLLFDINIENNKNVGKVIIRATDEMDNVLKVDVQEGSNKLNCIVNDIESNDSKDVFLKLYILTKEEYTNYLAKKVKLEKFKFGVSSFNLEMLRRRTE